MKKKVLAIAALLVVLTGGVCAYLFQDSIFEKMAPEDVARLVQFEAKIDQLVFEPSGAQSMKGRVIIFRFSGHDLELESDQIVTSAGKSFFRSRNYDQVEVVPAFINGVMGFKVQLNSTQINQLLKGLNTQLAKDMAFIQIILVRAKESVIESDKNLVEGFNKQQSYILRLMSKLGYVKEGNKVDASIVKLFAKVYEFMKICLSKNWISEELYIHNSAENEVRALFFDMFSEDEMYIFDAIKV